MSASGITTLADLSAATTADPASARSSAYDIIVIGGGVSGVAITREAALRGQRVLCVEKNDFGWATSAATSRLLHGGLRYLANFEFGLVRESLRERRILACAAPHLVRPLKFLVPIYREAKPTRAEMKIALLIYDALAFDRNRGMPEDKRLPGHRWLNRAAALANEPDLATRSPDGGELQGAFIYYDYQNTFPERLVLEWIQSGAAAGASYLNHCAAVGLRRLKQGAVSVELRDTLDGSTHTLQARLVINASGPYLDRVLGLLDETDSAKAADAQPTSAARAPVRLKRSTGVHLLCDPLFEPKADPREDHTVFIKGRKNDQFLILPWQGRSLIGPTDQSWEGENLDELRPRETEIAALISDLEASLPEGVFRPEMVRHAITGLRPLIDSGQQNALPAEAEKGPGSTRAISRRSAVFDHGGGLLSVGGGKWTTSRALGEETLEYAGELFKAAGHPLPHSRKHYRRLSRTSAFPGAPGFAESYAEYASFALREYQTPGVGTATHRHLIQIYGRRHTQILDLIQKQPELGRPINPDHTTPGGEILDVFAQIDHAVLAEGARSLDDILRRRLSLGLFGLPADAVLGAIAAHAGASSLLNWPPERQAAEIQAVQAIFRERLP